MKVYFRKARKEDIKEIMMIIRSAQVLLKEDGSDQWQDGSPSREQLLQDIEENLCHLLLINDCIVGTASLLERPDPNYHAIYQGEWQYQAKYTTIHRLAIDQSYRGRGLASNFLAYLISYSLSKGFNYIRIDTHEQNYRVQALVESFNFHCSGLVYVSPGPKGERLVYELEIEALNESKSK